MDSKWKNNREKLKMQENQVQYSLRQFIGANNYFKSLNYIAYSLSTISLFVIISIIYLQVKLL